MKVQLINIASVITLYLFAETNNDFPGINPEDFRCNPEKRESKSHDFVWFKYQWFVTKKPFDKEYVISFQFCSRNLTLVIDV